MVFEDIYSLYYKNVYRFFYYKFVSKPDIEDLSHDVFLRFYSKFNHKSCNEDEARKLLYGICRNVYKEWVRNCIKSQSNIYCDDLDYSISYEDFYSEGFEQKRMKQKEALLHALETLNPVVKQVLELRFFKGLTRKETAEKLGIKEKEVHTYQKRGIQYIHKRIHGFNSFSLEMFLCF